MIRCEDNITEFTLFNILAAVNRIVELIQYILRGYKVQ